MKSCDCSGYYNRLGYFKVIQYILRSKIENLPNKLTRLTPSEFLRTSDQPYQRFPTDSDQIGS